MEITRNVEINWKYNPSAFEKINKKALGGFTKRLGATRRSVNYIMTQTSMLNKLMPIVLGITPGNNETDWTFRLKAYWDSISVLIDENGKKLETGFSFDINDITLKSYIDELKKKHTDIKTTDDLAKYVMGMTDKGLPNIVEENKWKYGNPLNTEEYLLWRFLLNHVEVANTPNEVNKSQKIRFFITSDDLKKAAEKQRSTKIGKATGIYSKLVTANDNDKMEAILIAMNPHDIMKVVKEYDESTKRTKLFDAITKDVDKFITLATSKTLGVTSTIEKYIALGILTRPNNSELVFDNDDPTIVIGNNMDECINYFSNPDNKGIVSKYEIRYKQAIK